MKLDFTMQDARFGALVAFAAVAEERSFTRAARRLRVSPSAVSQSVRRLERRVGVPLLARTSRRVDVTDAGARLLARATPALAELASTLEAARAEAGEVGGTLRVTAPTIAAGLLPPVLERYLGAHPAARVEITLEDRLVNLVEQGFDVGVRLEESVPVEMVAVRISRPFRFVVVASPSYLAARGEPRTLRQLASHACIGLRMPTSGTLYRWELERPGRDGRRASVRPQLPARLVVHGHGFDFAARAAKHGLGLAYVDELSVAEALARGELRVVLPRYAARVSGFFLYFPPASRASPQVRAFVAAARAAARERGEAPPEGRD